MDEKRDERIVNHLESLNNKTALIINKFLVRLEGIQIFLVVIAIELAVLIAHRLGLF